MHWIIFRAIDHWEVGWLCFPVWWKWSMWRMLVYALASFKERIWEPKRRHQQTCHENHCRGRLSSMNLGLSQLRGNWLVCTCTQEQVPCVIEVPYSSASWWPAMLVHSLSVYQKAIKKKEYQQNFYSPQLYMPKRKVQNCWKVTQLNPKLSNKFLQLLPGLVFPKHSLVRDSGKLYDVHLLVL